MTIPKNIYKESNLLWPVEEGKTQENYDTESWSFYLIAKLTNCTTPVHPVSAHVEFRSDNEVVKTIAMTQRHLAEYRVPEDQVATESEEVYILIWNHFIEPTALRIEKLVYSLAVRDSKGAAFKEALEIPVIHYQQKTQLSFPVKGKCIVAVGHEYNEHHRMARSQFAYDIFPLSPRSALLRKQGTTNKDWYGYGVPVIAPADGIVAYSRDDIPENPQPNILPDQEFYRTIPESHNATAGNHVTIDHQNDEYSLLAHLKHGTVTVQKEDQVTKGQQIGCVGNSGQSGAPHLHYGLSNSPEFLTCDGLPSHFDNLTLLGLQGKVTTPKRGLFLIAK